MYKKARIFYAPSAPVRNGHLILSLVLGFYPSFLKDTRINCISYAVERNDLDFLHALMDFEKDDAITSVFLRQVLTQSTRFDLLEFFSAKLKAPMDQLEELFEKIVENGLLCNAQWLYKKGLLKLSSRIFTIAVKYKSQTLLQWLYKNQCPWDTNTFATAVGGGCRPQLKWLHQSGCPWDEKAFAAAARHGSFTIIQWLYENKCPWDETATAAAADSGHLAQLEWLYHRGCPWDERTFEAAARHGSTTILKWLHLYQCPCDGRALRAAGLSGNTQVFDLLVAKNCKTEIRLQHDPKPLIQNWLLKIEEPEVLTFESEKLLLLGAAQGNKTEIFASFVHEKRWLMDSDLLDTAAQYGSFEVVHYLLLNGCPTSQLTLARAAQYGCLQNVRWITVGSECPINDRSFTAAALNGNLEIMRWFLFKGGFWSQMTFRAAALNGSLRNMKWLKEKRCPMNDAVIFVFALYQGSLDNLKWLKDNGCPIDPILTEPIASEITVPRALEMGNQDMIDWLKEIGCPFPDSNSNTLERTTSTISMELISTIQTCAKLLF